MKIIIGTEINLNLEGIDNEDLDSKLKETIESYAHGIVSEYIFDGYVEGLISFPYESDGMEMIVTGSWKMLQASDGIKDLLKAIYQIVNKISKNPSLNLANTEAQVEGVYLDGFEVINKIKDVLESMDGIKLE